MQTPCDAEMCFPVGMYTNKRECKGSTDEDHHCVDCGGLWWDDKLTACNKCGNNWCTDNQQTFVSSGCEHFEERYEEHCDDEEPDEFCLAFAELDEPMCSSCYLRGTLDCKVEGCKMSRAKVLENWINFCKRPVQHSSATIEHGETKIKLSISYGRVEVDLDDEAVIDPWPIDPGKAILCIDKEFTTFTGETAQDDAIKKAKEFIAKKQEEGFTYRTSYLSHPDGAFRLPKKRDASPKRKKLK
jgi:hypothetical protein